ncbi:uncharacterized protein LOC114541907 [Dendronephthya gigantea]|uniref:uncharacterized protein LOC114541907 n=1 Tax=Dendronephthya gigantea TaxID=151771 RepID=UPI00106D06B9|nr:uncharacterized protein LOC114541907 [Dendronephthya gigantea]
MQGIYEFSSADRVKRLEDDLSNELKELQNAIEENDFLKVTKSSQQKSFSSVQLPKDAGHFQRERKIALTKALRVREARDLECQADTMMEEITICGKEEYTNKSLPLLLHQFYVDRIKELVHCKHMHMLRWARFCEHTKTIETLYPAYQGLISSIMAEYQDALDRARRLSVAREAALAGNETAMNVVTLDDLLIYTRSLICQLHSVKKIHAFLKIIEWLPYSHTNAIKLEHQKPEPQSDPNAKTSTNLKVRKRYSKVMSQVSVAMQLNLLRATTSEDSPPTPPPISLSSYQLVATKSPSIAAIAAASGGGLATDEVNLGIPLHHTSIEQLKPMLEFLLGCYAIEMDVHQVNTFADEMELFTMVSRKFKKIFSRQEQLRSFTVYDALIEEITDSKIRSQGTYRTFKKESNWLPFLHIRPETNGEQVKMMTKLRQQNNIDEIIKTHSSFLKMQDPQRVMAALREHARAVVEHPVPQAVSVTTHKTNYDTSAVWKKIFAQTMPQSSREDVFDFDAKLGEDVSGQKDSEYELGTAVDMLGLEDEDSRARQATQGAYMSYLLLRHLRLRDLQRTCLSVLNYCRSVERTLTINDSGLSLESGRQKATNDQVFHSGGVQGLGSHQYIHNTPADFVVEQNEFMQYSEVENHDDFYVFEEGRVHVQDQRGLYVMYDTAIHDFRNLERDLLLVATQFIQNDKKNIHARKSSKNFSSKFKYSDVDISSYGHQNVDRFGVLLDVWSNEAIYQENKRQLLDTYFEAYQHTFNPNDKRNLAQVMVNILHQRPRFDFNEPYLVKLYRAENICLRLHCNLVKSVLDKQIADQREYVQKVTRDGDSEFGLPHRIIPKQSIAVNTSRPCLKYVYMLEFHPSLALAASLPKSIKHVLQIFLNASQPAGFMELINVEKCLFELIQKEWDNMEVVGIAHSQQTQKDLFSEVFVEDPLFVCEVGQSQLSALESKSAGRRSVKERQQSLISTWCDLLEVLTLRHRLITSAHETEVLMKVYKRKCKEFGFDEHHAYLRAVSFDLAQLKPEAELYRISIDTVLDDDGRIDRYTPGSLPLAIQEIDEKYAGTVNFRTREGLLQLIGRMGVEKLQVILASQVVHKNLLAAAVILGGECGNAVSRERRSGTSVNKNISPSAVPKVPTVTTMDFLDPGSHDSSGTATPTQMTFTTHVKREKNHVTKLAFVSAQLEKAWLRDMMLNEYVTKKTTMSTVLKNVDETMKLKRTLILSFSQALQMSVSEYSLRAQIISYCGSLLDLMSQFPTTRDSHFMIGIEFEPKPDEQEKSLEDPTPSLTSRARKLLSNDGRQMINLWYIPHFTEVLNMFAKSARGDRNKRLKTVLQIVSCLHDICQYLCAHARLGSSHARLGSQKLEFSGVTADWGGTEGIGAELREIQKQINHLENPSDPEQIAEFLRHRRDVMYLEFDLSVSHCVPDTFLQTGNELACKSITDQMEFALQNLSNVERCSVYNWSLPVPDLFNSLKEVSSNLVPWRSFLARNGPFSLQYWPWFEIGTNMQLCLAGLRDVDRHVVNGEILGVSLQLEDVLQNGLPDDILGQADDSSSVTSTSSALRVKDRKLASRLGSARSSQAEEVPLTTASTLDIPRGQLSFNTDPLSAIKLLQLFLISWSRLEVLKRDWGCRKLGVSSLATTKNYKACGKAFKIDVLLPVYQQIASKKGIPNDYSVISTVCDDEPLATPPSTTDMELKIKQLVRLLENFECSMIGDVIKKISREHTLVLTERGREDATLPTDLWKRPVMKETTTIEKPHLVENFVQTLMNDHVENEDTLTFSKAHFNACLVKLASETMVRERSCFNGYAMYYENLLRHQHQLLYTKEQEIKQIQSSKEDSEKNSQVDIDCQLADKSHELLLEITALRAKIKELSDQLTNQESEIRERLTKDYNTLVRGLFSRCFSIKNKFEEFRGSLYDDVLESLSDVRRQAMENMRKIRERTGTLKDDVETESSIHLARAERIRAYQEENKHLGALFYKVKTLNFWKNTRLSSHHFETVTSLRDEADRAKKECLDIKKMTQEKELLLIQEQTALRKALEQVEKEAHTLKKKLSHEQKAKLQKTHARIQEARSSKQMELAKSTNIDKLISDLDEREDQLRALTANLLRDQKKNSLVKEHSKKTKKLLQQQLEHERNLKLGAFERVDELQRQVYDYEQVYELPLNTRPQTTPPSLLPPTSNSRLTSGNHGNHLTNERARRRAFSSKIYTSAPAQEKRPSYSGNLWSPNS